MSKRPMVADQHVVELIKPISDPQEGLREALRAELLALPFHAFEACMKEVLMSLGYTQVRLMGRTEWHQPTRHGGVDIEASAKAGVSQTRLIVQVKQYQRPVSRRFIDELRGTLMRLHGGQGLIISTSTFSKVAKQAAERDKVTPIRLVDGAELLDLLIFYHIGVYQEQAGAPWMMDTDYFITLQRLYPSRSKKPASNKNVPEKPVNLSTNVRVADDAVRVEGGGMMARTHILGGVSTLWLMKLIPGVLTPDSLGILAGMAALGALLPDLDASEATIKHVRVFGLEPFAPLSVLAHRAFGHRGLLHSIMGLALVGLVTSPIALFVGWPSYLALLLGYASHLLLDAMTPAGIPFLLRRGVRQRLLPENLRITTGSPEEEGVYAFLALLVFVLVLLQIAHF